MCAVSWKPVKGEKGLYVRDYGKTKVWQIQSMCHGRRYTDTLGAMSLDEARIIRDQLAYNRKREIAPLTYAEMINMEAQHEAAERIETDKKINDIIKYELQRRDNTVSKFWENRYWPHRIALKRSQKENEAKNGRWINHLKPFFGEIPIAEVSKRHFEHFVELKRNERKISESTIFKCITDLRQLWAYATEEEAIDKSFPGKAAIKELISEIDNEKKCWLTPDEASILVQTVWERRMRGRVDHDVYCFVILGLGLGLRAGDICKLTAQTVERHIIERTKNKRSRFVHFNFAPVKAMLNERLSLYPPDGPTEPLFISGGQAHAHTQRSMVPRKYYDIIKELGFNQIPRRKDHPLEKIDFHALRHTFATLAAMRGVDHLTLMRLMGHKTPSMTLRYIEIADAHQAKYQEMAMEGIFPKELTSSKKNEICDHEIEAGDSKLF